MMDINTLLNSFLIPAAYFVVILLFLLVVKVVTLLLGRNTKKLLILEDKISAKYSYLLLGISVILCLLNISPIAAKGYDCPLSVFTVDYIKVNGPLTVFRTDRPLTFYIMFVVGEFLNIPGRVSVQVSTIIFTILYVLSIFFLTYTLTKNKFLSSIASLFAVDSNLTINTALCWIGQMLAFAFLYLFFSAIIMFYRTKNMRRYGFLSVLLFTLLLFTHIITSIVGLIVLVVFCGYLLLRKETILFKKIVMIGIICLLFLIIHLKFYPESYVVLSNIVDFSLKLKTPWLMGSWCSIFLWVFIFSTIGFWFVLFKQNICGMFLTSWIVGILVFVSLSPGNNDRLFIMLPLPIVSALGLFCVVYYCSKVHKTQLYVFVILFLVLTPCMYYSTVSYTNIRYFQEGPFLWDTQHIETEQLKWIAKNYNIDNRVILTDVSWNQNYTNLKLRNLYPGVHMRILAEVGNNVYFGKLVDFFEEKPDCRHYKQYPSVMPGRYSSLNVDWTSKNKTILIPSTIYNIHPLEEEIVYKLSNTDIYVVKNLTEQEKIDWLKRWYEEI